MRHIILTTDSPRVLPVRGLMSSLNSSSSATRELWHSSSGPQSFWKGISSSLLASFLFRIGN